MVDALTWFLAVEVLGLLVLPVVFVLFRQLPDRGYTLAKPASLVLFSYVLWVLGLTQVVPNTRLTVIVILLLGAVVGALVLRKVAGELKIFIKENWPLIVAAEVIFIGFFLLWLGIVSEAPAINHTEKPMDFGFINAVLQSRFFPPEDPWLAGNSISYYYFGHFMMAFVTQVTGVASSVGYNLGVSLIPALAAMGAFGLIYNLVRLSGGSVKAGLVFGGAAPLLVILAGNLEGGLEFVKTLGWGGDGFWTWVGIKGLEGDAVVASGGFPDQFWWWFRASRVIDTLVDGQSLDYTITEFPVFSFILGDLHPHVMNLPFVILGIGVILNVYRSPHRFGVLWLRQHAWQALTIGLIVGSLAFINTWDLPTISALLAVGMLLKSYRDYGGDLRQAVASTAVVFLPIFAVAIVAFAPFYVDLDGQTSGVLPLQDVATRPFLLFIGMGLFIVLALAFIGRQLFGLSRPSQADAPAAIVIMTVAVTPMVLWGVTAFLVTLFTDGLGAAFDEIGRRSILVVPGVLIVGAAGFSAARRARLGLEPVTAFVLVLAGLGFYLLVGTELFYIVDSFGGEFRRMNTVFKSYYQVWLLLGITGTYSLYYLWSHREAVVARIHFGPIEIAPRMGSLAIRAGRYLGAGGVAVLLVASFYYSVGAALERTGVLDSGHTVDDNTLDGLAFIQDLRPGGPGEYAAIEWLRDEAPWGRIVEAVGDDYSEYGRISSSTGLPTVLGWKGHELQWRGSYASFDGREEAVREIYTSSDPDVVRRLMETYDVRYVYLGHREKRNYGVSDLTQFDGFLRTAFQQDGVVVYEIVPGEIVPGEMTPAPLTKNETNANAND